MPLRRVYQRKFKNVNMESGHFYKFRYKPYEHDPYPTVLFLHFIVGEHPNTGHQWRLFQAINFHYIPRAVRIRFLKRWLKLTERGGKVRLNWQKIVAKFPYIAPGIRRYQFKPASYITKLEEIERDEIEQEVVGGLFKDFSKKVISRLRGLFSRRKRQAEAERQRKKISKRRKKLAKDLARSRKITPGRKTRRKDLR